MFLRIARFDCTADYTVSRITLHASAASKPVVATFYGMELPWRENKAKLSCIPCGVYALIPYKSPTKGATWAFVGGTVSPVPWPGVARSLCLIHVGNFASDVEGCVALGKGNGFSQSGLRMVTQSKAAMTTLRTYLDKEPFHLAHILEEAAEWA